MTVIPQFMLPYEQKRLIFENKRYFYRNNKIFCGIKSYDTFECCLSALTQPQNRIALPTISCSKSAQKSAVQMCQVAAVVMETTQLVLTFYRSQWTIE